MQCIRAFVSQPPDELSLEKADIILVHQQSSDGKTSTPPTTIPSVWLQHCMESFGSICWHPRLPTFPRLGGGDQTVRSTSWMGPWVPFGTDNQLSGPTTQSVRCPQANNSHSYSMTWNGRRRRDIQRRLSMIRLSAGLGCIRMHAGPNEELVPELFTTVQQVKCCKKTSGNNMVPHSWLYETLSSQQSTFCSYGGF